MITYEYEDLFREHISCDMVIVDASAEVVPVQQDAPTITGNTFLVNNENLIAESFHLSESLCSEQNLKFGKCEAASVSFDIINDPENPIAALKDKKIAVYLYFDGDSDTLFKVGEYIVANDVRSDDRLQRAIEAYDVLYYIRELDVKDWYDAALPNVNASKTIKDFRDSLFDYLEENGYCTQTTRTLVNDTFEIGRTIEAESIPCGQLLECLCELNGVFGHINRDGVFDYIELADITATPAAVITNDWRLATESHEDYTVYSIRIAKAYDSFGINIAGSGSRPVDVKRPSTYNIADNVFLDDRNGEDDTEDVQEMLANFLKKARDRRYVPMSLSSMADLCIEVGDRISVNGRATYVLTRSVSGVQMMIDSIAATGDLKQPPYSGEPNFDAYNDKWHNSDAANSGGRRPSGGRGTSTYTDLQLDDFFETIRNVGLRVLDEPEIAADLYDDNTIEIKWSDPPDIPEAEPAPVEWAGTVVVKKAGAAPRHVWEGTVIVDSTTRDQYAENGITDSVESFKTYYYGIFPYDTEGHYRPTKILQVDTGYVGGYPEITGIAQPGANVVVSFTLPEGNWSAIKLVYKEEGIPQDVTDGTAVDLSASDTSKSLGGDLEAVKTYFKIFMSNDNYIVDSNVMSFTPNPPPYALNWNCSVSHAEKISGNEFQNRGTRPMSYGEDLLHGAYLAGGSVRLQCNNNLQKLNGHSMCVITIEGGCSDNPYESEFINVSIIPNSTQYFNSINIATFSGGWHDFDYAVMIGSLPLKINEANTRKYQHWNEIKVYLMITPLLEIYDIQYYINGELIPFTNAASVYPIPLKKRATDWPTYDLNIVDFNNTLYEYVDGKIGKITIQEFGD